MTKANYSLRLQPSLKTAAEKFAAVEGTSLNQFINVPLPANSSLTIHSVNGIFHRWHVKSNTPMSLAIGGHI